MIAKIREQDVKLRWIGEAPGAIKRVALLIPQYNEGKNFDLEGRLHYFRKLASENKHILDVILIDDGSTDGSLARIAEFCTEHPGCFYFASVRPNSQKVGALYVVSAVIKHQYVLLSDFDTDLAHLHHLEDALNRCDEEPGIMGCYFRMIPLEGQGRPSLFQQLEYFFARIYYNFHKKDQSVPVMPGAGSCYKREMLLQIYASHSGNRNGEDREATVIGLKLGFKTIYADAILALTRPPRTFKALLVQRKRWYLGYIETVFKEKLYYCKSVLKGKSIGLRTLQDALGVGLMLMLPIELLLLFAMSWKLAAGIIAGAYLSSVLYYSILFASSPKERPELRQRHRALLPLYPLFWLAISFFAWWKAFLSFRKERIQAVPAGNEGETITEEDVLIHYDPATCIIGEPFVGQTGYINSLARPAAQRVFNETPFADIHIQMHTVDKDALENTIAFFINRHESLRTIFPVIDGKVKSVTLPYEKSLFGINYIEVATEEEYSRAKKETYSEAAKHADDIGKGPLTKIFLFKVHNGGCYFHLLVHHLFMDRWSMKLIKEELEVIYSAFFAGEQPPFTPLAIQLRHYCERENNWQRTNALKLGAYWKSKLDTFYTLLNVKPYYDAYRWRKKTFDIAEPSPQYDDVASLMKILNRHDGAACSFLFSLKKLKAIKKLAQRNGSNVSAVIFAAFYLLNYIYTGRKTTMLSVPVVNRSVPGYRSIIGWLLGAIYLPYTIKENAMVDDIISQTFSDIGEGISHMIYNQEMLNLHKDQLTSSSDFCVNYMFSNDPAKVDSDEPEKIHVPDKNIWYGINCQLIESPNGLVVKWKYNVELFSRELIDDLIQCYEEILAYLTENDNCSVKDLLHYLNMAQQQAV